MYGSSPTPAIKTLQGHTDNANPADKMGITNVSILHYGASGYPDMIHSYQSPNSKAAITSRTLLTVNGNQQPISLKRNYSNSKSEEYKFT